MGRVRTGRCAILFGDIVGYSRLLQFNDATAVESVVARKTRFKEEVSRHGGLIVHSVGDSVLCRFETAWSAVQAALAIQAANLRENVKLSPGEQIAFRIGIEVGDVYSIQSDLHGHEVNVAARLQDLIGPSEICISETVLRAVHTRIPARVTALGEVPLWNIKTPVRAHAIDLNSETTVGRHEALSALGGFLDLSNNSDLTFLTGLKKPHILVFPLQEVGADAPGGGIGRVIADEIVTALSRLPEVTVMGVSALDQLPEAPRKLSAQGAWQATYLIDGSAVRSPSFLRLNINLRNAESYRVVWANRYFFEDFSSFDFLQDVSRNVCLALQIQLTEGEQAQVWAGTSSSFAAWELYQRAQQEIRKYRAPGHQAGKCYLERALRLDPSFLAALVLRGFCNVDAVRAGWFSSREQELHEAKYFLNEAQKIDPHYPECLSLEAFIAIEEREVDRAVEAIDRAVEFAPTNNELIACRGTLMTMLGEFQSATADFRRAMSATPHFSPWMPTVMGLAYCLNGDLEKSEVTLRAVNESSPAYMKAYPTRAVACVRLGRMREAREVMMQMAQLGQGSEMAAWERSDLHIEERERSRFIQDLKGALAG